MKYMCQTILTKISDIFDSNILSDKSVISVKTCVRKFRQTCQTILTAIFSLTKVSNCQNFCQTILTNMSDNFDAHILSDKSVTQFWQPYFVSQKCQTILTAIICLKKVSDNFDSDILSNKSVKSVKTRVGQLWQKWQTILTAIFCLTKMSDNFDSYILSDKSVKSV